MVCQSVVEYVKRISICNIVFFKFTSLKFIDERYDMNLSQVDVTVYVRTTPYN